MMSGIVVLQLPNVIPQPESIQVDEGFFEIKPSCRIVAKGDAISSARFLRNSLEKPLGFEINIASISAKGDIVLSINNKETLLGDEGYRLKVDTSNIEIVGQTSSGLFYGIQTLLQLLPVEVFRRSKVDEKWRIQCLQIFDRPRFEWRGSHLDVGRHFLPKEYLFKHVDLMAIHKLNRFHLHLTEDQGWRIEIKRYPKLTRIGAWRKDTMLKYNPPIYSGHPHGGYYTQEDLRELVRYAADRNITIVPEIEMPGHSQAAIAAYPELGNTGKQLEVATRWGVIEHIFNVEESTFEFLQNVLREVMDIFPGKYIHIGGDEVPKKEWKESESAQRKMKDLRISNEEELQSYFIKRIGTFIEAHSRRFIGWDEILEGGLAPGAIVMSWRGSEGGIAAAKMGHDVVMAPTSHTYFDYYQSKNLTNEPHAIGGYLPLELVYSYDPVPSELDDVFAKRILGAQAQLWTEYMPNTKHVEYMAYPRLCALSEVTWSTKDNKDYTQFIERLKTHLRRLDILDVNYRRLD
jgi:hexosaminidase